MKDVKKSLQDTLTSAFAKEGVPPQNKYKIMKSIEMAESQKSENKSPEDFLNDPEDMKKIYLLVKNKKLSANKIREKIRELLKEPDQLRSFLQTILDKKPKKEENKEATSAGGAGQFSAPLFSTTKGDLVSGVKTVREEVLKGGNADKMTLLDIAKKHANDDSTDPTSKEKIEKIHKELKSQLNKGIKTEMEHTKDKDKAKEIAMDHLYENPKYYDKLTKIETKEATTSASSGQYSQPAIWAKSMSKKHWKGASTKYMPGAKRVQVKKKCKTFPYCNQGDIKALKIFESESVQNAIESVSVSHGYDKNYISEIVFREIKKRQN
jgi:hypothetical protein